jgi:hypothetical protein
MAINGRITTNEFQHYTKAILQKFGVVTYARCWFELMILHRHTLFLESVFACLTPDGERAYT